MEYKCITVRVIALTPHATFAWSINGIISSSGPHLKFPYASPRSTLSSALCLMGGGVIFARLSTMQVVLGVSYATSMMASGSCLLLYLFEFLKAASVLSPYIRVSQLNPNIEPELTMGLRHLWGTRERTSAARRGDPLTCRPLSLVLEPIDQWNTSMHDARYLDSCSRSRRV